MKELIWFSIPGAVFLLPVLIYSPDTVIRFKEASIIIVLVLGFILHQIFRLLFEGTDGWARRSRKVIGHLSEMIGNDLTREQAFGIWELTFYSEKFPTAFREHNRGSWSFTLSFWAISMSALFSLPLCVTLQNTDPKDGFWFASLLGFELFLAIVFLKKGYQTYDENNKQEIAVVKIHEDLFRRSALKMFGVPFPGTKKTSRRK